MKRRDAVKTLMLMLGGSLSPSVAMALKSEPKLRAAGTGFSDVQRQLVSMMSERIIPTTDTPGAIAAGVPAFIEEIVFDWYTENERKIFCLDCSRQIY
nr:gluconate 2-dehydrogenase subunit 3 family protein [Oceanicoccus sp. KOV_DT_Chl]